MSEILMQLPGQANRSLAGVAAAVGLALVAFIGWRLYEIRHMDDDLAAMTAIALLVASALAEVALYFNDDRDWWVLSKDGLSLPRFYRGEIPLNKLACIEEIPPTGSRKNPMVRIAFTEPITLNMARPALCPRRLHRSVTALVLTKPQVMGLAPVALVAMAQAYVRSKPQASGSEVLISQKPQDAQGSLAGVAVVFGLSMIVTALIRTI